MKKTGQAILAIAVLVVGGLLITQTDIFSGNNQLSLGGSSGGSGTTTPDSVSEVTKLSGVQDYQGNLNVSVQTFDAEDPSLTYGDDTEVDTICYERNGDDPTNWRKLDSASEAELGDMDIPVVKGTSASDTGLTEMWCEINLESSQAFYVAKDDIVQRNAKVDKCIWDDANLDNTDTYICRVNLLDIKPTTDNEATMTLTWYLWDEETDDTLMNISAGTSVASAGQGKVENRVKYDFDFNNDADTKSMIEVRLRLNSTDDSQWFENDSYIDIPTASGTERVKLAQMDRTDLASTTVYKWSYGTDYSQGNMIIVPKSGDTEFDIPLILYTNFDASDEALCTELGVRWVDGVGAIASYDADDIEVAEGLVGDECSIS